MTQLERLIEAIRSHRSPPENWTHYNDGFNQGLEVAISEVVRALQDEPKADPVNPFAGTAAMDVPALGVGSIPFTHWSKDPLIPYTGCTCSSCEDMRRYRTDLSGGTAENRGEKP